MVNGQAPLIFVHNSSTVNNSHICSFDLGLACYPNVGSGIVTRGIWTKIEVYVKDSTSKTSRDGVLRWWINGQLAGNYTNFNWWATGWDGWLWTETWDGCGTSGVGCDLGSVNTVDWSHYMDHLRVSVPNCSGSCGGGTTPPPPALPPPPPPLPPNMPSNLRVQ